MTQVELLLDRWREHFNTRRFDLLVQLYADAATLFGTSKSKLHKGAAEIESYFQSAHDVSFQDWETVWSRLDIALVAGTYTFSKEQDGRFEEIPARFSLLLDCQGDRLLILHHHSSAVPKD